MVHRLVEEYGDRIKLVYRHFPLASIHRYAIPAAEAVEAAGEQGKYWEMEKQLFANQVNLSEEMIYETARGLGLDMARFNDAMKQHKYLARVQADFEEGKRKGIQGTPTFIVGQTVVRGLPTWEKMEAAVLKELQSK